MNPFEMKPFEIEVTRKVLDNENGWFIEVGPDKDGLGLIEITGIGAEGKIFAQPAHALLLAKAIKDAAEEMMK